jgi:hypothetical protein
MVRGAMSNLRYVPVGLILMATTFAVDAAGLPPWEFGMSRDAVASFSDYGPYKKFKNGDLETYDGVFNGNRENVQFFFDNSGLRRIGVYIYEGADLSLAKAKWQRAYDALISMYGPVDTPTLAMATAEGKAGADILADAAGAKVEAGMKVQMAPKKQPPGLFVFSSFSRQEIQGTQHYYITIYYDPGHL